MKGFAQAAFGSPAEKREVVDERFGEDAHLAEAGDRGGSVAFGEAFAIGAEDGGEVGELGDLPAEGLVDGDLLWGVRDVVVAADDVGDLHERVVDGDDVVVDGDAGGGSAGGADEDRVADCVGGELDVAANDVVEA